MKAWLRFPVRRAGCCRISWWKHPPSLVRFCKASNFFMAELSFTRENHWLLQPLRTSVGGLTAALSDVVETSWRPKKLTQQRKMIKLKNSAFNAATNPRPAACARSLLLWTRHIGSLTAIRVPSGTGRRGCQTLKLYKRMHLSIVILPMLWRCC